MKELNKIDFDNYSNEEIKLLIISLENEYNALGIEAEKILSSMDEINLKYILAKEELIKRRII